MKERKGSAIWDSTLFANPDLSFSFIWADQFVPLPNITVIWLLLTITPLFPCSWCLHVGMPQRILVILPPLLLLVLLSCLLTFYYLLSNLSQNVNFPSSPPSQSLLSSCENVFSPSSPLELSLWQIVRPLLQTLEVLWLYLHPHPHHQLSLNDHQTFRPVGGQSVLLPHRWISSIFGQVVIQVNISKGCAGRGEGEIQKAGAGQRWKSADSQTKSLLVCL